MSSSGKALEKRLPSYELAIWYASKAKGHLREGNRLFQGFRYPECVSAFGTSIEFASKALCAFLGADYKPTHTLAKPLTHLSVKFPDQSKELSRAAWISSRWVGADQQTRLLASYGNQDAAVPATKFIIREELASTKLRALMERFKGRDIYDLYYISALKPKPTVTRKMFLYYFYRSRKIFNPKIHYHNLVKRYESRFYVDDVSAFVRPTVEFNLSAAAKEVISSYSFLNDFDPQDKVFLQLGSMLLGRKVRKERISMLRKIRKPLALLFSGIEISKEARGTSTNEIKLYRKHKQKQSTKTSQTAHKHAR
jgi:HEPN domain-containing protein